LFAAAALLLAFLPGSAVSDLSIETGVVVATYEYPGRDRLAAVTPLAELAGELSDVPAAIRIAESPTQLAEWVASGQIDVAIPNLVGYLAMRSEPDGLMDMVVPALTNDGPRADADSLYTSSIVAADSSPIRELGELRGDAAPERVYMVWPDSASGALLARSKLRQVLGEDADALALEFTGSHQAVFERVTRESTGVGVLATRVYLELNASEEHAGMRELWRSPAIPFGPLVCAARAKDLCYRLRQRLLEQSPESAAVLAGLKSGWPEFASASAFAIPNPADYAELIDVYASSHGIHRLRGARGRL